MAAAPNPTPALPATGSTRQGTPRLSSVELAERYNIPEGPLRKELRAWRRTTEEGWEKVPKPGEGNTKYRYQPSAVMHIIRRLQKIAKSGDHYGCVSRANKRLWKQHEVKTDTDGTICYSLRKAAAYLGVAPGTVWRWGKHGCPALGGEKLRTRQLVGARGSDEEYYEKAHLDEVRRRRKALRERPTDDEVLAFPDFAESIGLSRSRTYQIYSARERRLGARKNGTPCLRSVVPRDRAAQVEQDRPRPLPPGRLSTKEAARRLNVGTVSIQAWHDDCPYIFRPLDRLEGRFQTARGVKSGLFPLASEIAEIKKALRQTWGYVNDKGSWRVGRLLAKRHGVPYARLLDAYTGGLIRGERVPLRSLWKFRGKLVLLESSVERWLRDSHEAVAPKQVGGAVEASLDARVHRTSDETTHDLLREIRCVLERAPAPAADPARSPIVAVYLWSWKEITTALGLKNNDVIRRQLKQLNRAFGGPIHLPGPGGGQPKADRAALVAWWNSLKDKLHELDARDEQAEADAEGTVSGQHNYGRDGTAVPGIGGHVKKRRRGSSPD